jgi:magnesium transporter
LQAALEEIGRQGELLGRVRLSLLTLERALSFFGQTLAGRPESEELKELLKGEMRDIQALSVHGDFLSSRVSLAVDATMGMINLAQNATVRILSVVAALFLPPTLIASIYGMNFRVMPELDWSWGYPGALVLMVASAVATWAFFKWRGWL